MDFVAIDVETANPDLASICQIGLVAFEKGRAVDDWDSLVNPEDYFDSWNVSIHGIMPHMVSAAPRFPDLYLRHVLPTKARARREAPPIA